MARTRLRNCPSALWTPVTGPSCVSVCREARDTAASAQGQQHGYSHRVEEVGSSLASLKGLQIRKKCQRLGCQTRGQQGQQVRPLQSHWQNRRGRIWNSLNLYLGLGAQLGSQSPTCAGLGLSHRKLCPIWKPNGSTS